MAALEHCSFPPPGSTASSRPIRRLPRTRLIPQSAIPAGDRPPLVLPLPRARPLKHRLLSKKRPASGRKPPIACRRRRPRGRRYRPLWGSHETSANVSSRPRCPDRSPPKSLLLHGEPIGRRRIAGVGPHTGVRGWKQCFSKQRFRLRMLADLALIPETPQIRGRGGRGGWHGVNFRRRRRVAGPCSRLPASSPGPGSPIGSPPRGGAMTTCASSLSRNAAAPLRPRPTAVSSERCSSERCSFPAQAAPPVAPSRPSSAHSAAGAKVGYRGVHSPCAS